MYTPVDENAAAGLCFGGECTAEARNTAETAERAVDVIDIAELAFAV